jgi:dihydrofolate reductase
VYSRTRSYSGWVTTVRPQLAPAELVTAKAETDGDIVVFGSGRLAQDLARAGLVDEYHLLVQPVALGGGAPLFEPGRRTDLTLRRCEPLRAGVIRHFSVPATGPVERINYSS